MAQVLAPCFSQSCSSSMHSFHAAGKPLHAHLSFRDSTPSSGPLCFCRHLKLGDPADPETGTAFTRVLCVQASTIHQDDLHTLAAEPDHACDLDHYYHRNCRGRGAQRCMATVLKPPSECHVTPCSAPDLTLLRSCIVLQCRVIAMDTITTTSTSKGATAVRCAKLNQAARKGRRDLSAAVW